MRHLLLPFALLAQINPNCGSQNRFALTGQPAPPALDVIDASGDVDENAVLAAVEADGYQWSAAFAKASTGYPSSVATGSTIAEWVTAGALTTYQSITPAASGSHAAMPPGTMIVRAVEDSTGAVTKLTLMVKGEPGYNPDLGDWWFGETDPTGIPIVDSGGVELGKLSACYGCHLARSADDYLFGVPANARAPHP